MEEKGGKIRGFNRKEKKNKQKKKKKKKKKNKKKKNNNKKNKSVRIDFSVVTPAP